MYADPEGNFPLLLLAAVLLLTAVGGVALQATGSILSYTGMAIASIWDADIRKDMNNIGWNPFNNNTDLVLQSNKVSFYKGVPVFRTSANSRQGSFVGIFLPKSSRMNSDELRHELGHNIQQMIMGPILFLTMIGLPSALEWSSRPYYERPWEITADIFGGVPRNSTSLGRRGNRSYTDELRGWAYLAVSALFGPFGYLFLIGEY